MLSFLSIKKNHRQRILDPKRFVIGRGKGNKKGVSNALRNPFTVLFKRRLVVHWEPIPVEQPIIQAQPRPKSQDSPRPRPRVTPIKPKYDIVVCQICMGRIKQGLSVAKCECGKSFHDVCLERTGFCPYCHKTYDAGTVANISKKRDMPKVEKIPCPSCGQMISADAGQCDCGAVFVEDDQFDCADCGSVVYANSMVCGHCGVVYENYTPMLCPICSRVFNEETGLCVCGAFTGDFCPECGISIDSDERACPQCGTVFEYVGTPQEIAERNRVSPVKSTDCSTII
jgi:hypothetical protein